MAQINLAKRKAQHLIIPEGNKVLVPAVAAGAIIGKGGESIAKMQRETGARIKLSKVTDFYPGTEERVCLIQGSLDSVTRMHNYIMDCILERPEFIDPFYCAGSTTTATATRTTTINATNLTTSSEPHTAVTETDNEAAIAQTTTSAAATTTTTATTTCVGSSHGTAGDNTAYSKSSSSFPGQQFNPNVDSFNRLPWGRHKQVKILVPNCTAGLVIGKLGSYVKEIKDRTGAFIQVSQKSHEINLLERCIIVAAEPEQCRAAIDLILAKIAEDPQSGIYQTISYSHIHTPVASAYPTGSPFAITPTVLRSFPSFSSYSFGSPLSSLSMLPCTYLAQSPHHLIGMQPTVVQSELTTPLSPPCGGGGAGSGGSGSGHSLDVSTLLSPTSTGASGSGMMHGFGWDGNLSPPNPASAHLNTVPAFYQHQQLQHPQSFAYESSSAQNHCPRQSSSSTTWPYNHHHQQQQQQQRHQQPRMHQHLRQANIVGCDTFGDWNRLAAIRCNSDLQQLVSNPNSYEPAIYPFYSASNQPPILAPFLTSRHTNPHSFYPAISLHSCSTTSPSSLTLSSSIHGQPQSYMQSVLSAASLINPHKMSHSHPIESDTSYLNEQFINSIHFTLAMNTPPILCATQQQQQQQQHPPSVVPPAPLQQDRNTFLVDPIPSLTGFPMFSPPAHVLSDSNVNESDHKTRYFSPSEENSDAELSKEIIVTSHNSDSVLTTTTTDAVTTTTTTSSPLDTNDSTPQSHTTMTAELVLNNNNYNNNNNNNVVSEDNDKNEIDNSTCSSKSTDTYSSCASSHDTSN